MTITHKSLQVPCIIYYSISSILHGSKFSQQLQENNEIGNGKKGYYFCVLAMSFILLESLFISLLTRSTHKRIDVANLRIQL